MIAYSCELGSTFDFKFRWYTTTFCVQIFRAYESYSFLQKVLPAYTVGNTLSVHAAEGLLEIGEKKMEWWSELLDNDAE